MGERTTHNLRTGRFPLAPDLSVSKTARDRQQGAQPTQEDYRARFFEHYRKEAGEYDKEFLKKYDEDLNTTLIFVSIVSSSGVRMLKRVSGRSVLCGCFRIHHRRPISTSARHGRGDCRPPPSPYLQDRQHHLWHQCSHSSPMDWPPFYNCPSPSPALHKPFLFPPLSLPRNARQTVVEPICCH